MPVRKRGNRSENADVVVVGSGFAGLAAAIEAARAGCSVMVIEKRDAFGGNSRISGGVLAAVDAALQRRHGIEDSTRRMFDDMMRAGRGRNDPELAGLVCMHSGNVLEWLKKDMGVTFMERIDWFEGHTARRCHGVVGLEGRNIIDPMLKCAASLDIELRAHTSMEGFRQREDGAIRGILATDTRREEPESILIEANRAVILASGGFSAEALREQPSTNASEARLRTSLADSTAEVLRLAEQAGAALVDMEHLQMLPYASPDEDGRGVAPFFASYAVLPYGVLVNPADGKRFVNEWADRKTCAEAIMALGKPAIGITDTQGLIDAGEMIREYLDASVTRRFDDLAGLASAYGIPQEALQETLRTYNGYVEQKRDTAFGKPIPAEAKPLRAPYYALRLWPKAHFTMGGLRIDARAKVLDKAGRSIPGLYAAGEATGGVHGICRLSAYAITECLVFGRIAGQQAALQNGAAR
uniref:Flavocytochrome c n=1 Tax=Candidatus Kentrum sp. LPFa TaxID=2126335 RepID=A0A450W1L9_9GAMM|nr:MAG: flavocytochrome c [Candidatus Kentron sp. LPFa]